MTYTDQLVNSFTAGLAKWAALGAAQAIGSLAHSFGPASEPALGVLAAPYSRVLALAMVAVGTFIVIALGERVLGCQRAISWQVVPRTVAAVFAAFVGLSVLQYAAEKAELLSQVWGPDLGRTADYLVLAAQGSISPGPSQGSGGPLALIVLALLSTLLAVLVKVELAMRAAILMVTAALLPFLMVVAIWPRLTGMLHHTIRFLFTVLLSKFVMATALYVGLYSVSAGETTGGPNLLLDGLAVLALTAFLPFVLFQGVRATDLQAAMAAREIGSTVGKGALPLAQRALHLGGQMVRKGGAVKKETR
jgi:hypothetical protein